MNPAEHTVRDTRVDIVVPVYNEEAILESSICRLREHLTNWFPFRWRNSQLTPDN